MSKIERSINWIDLVEAIMEKLVLTQSELASELATTQQSVSNWLIGKTKPRGQSAQKLFALSSIAQINIEYFTTDYDQVLKDIKISRRDKKLISQIWSLDPRRRNSIIKELTVLTELYSTQKPPIN